MGSKYSVRISRQLSRVTSSAWQLYHKMPFFGKFVKIIYIIYFTIHNQEIQLFIVYLMCLALASCRGHHPTALFSLQEVPRWKPKFWWKNYKVWLLSQLWGWNKYHKGQRGGGGGWGGGGVGGEGVGGVGWGGGGCRMPATKIRGADSQSSYAVPYLAAAVLYALICSLPALLCSSICTHLQLTCTPLLFYLHSSATYVHWSAAYSGRRKSISREESISFLRHRRF